MNGLKIVKSELKLIRRDSMLFMMPFFIVYMGLVLHFLMPWLNGYLAAKGMMPGNVSPFGLDHYFPLIMYYMVIITGPQITGMVFAVLILTDKDDQTIKALMVSPLTAISYLKRKIAFSWSTGVLAILALFYMINIDMLPFWQLLMIAIGGGFTSTLITIGISIIAKNKVQGMSYAKAVSFIAMLILTSWFVPGSWQLFFGVIPVYWICKAYTLALGGQAIWLLYLGIGILYQGGATYWLSKVFVRKIYETI